MSSELKPILYALGESCPDLERFCVDGEYFIAGERWRKFAAGCSNVTELRLGGCIEWNQDDLLFVLERLNLKTLYVEVCIE